MFVGIHVKNKNLMMNLTTKLQLENHFPHIKTHILKIQLRFHSNINVITTHTHTLSFLSVYFSDTHTLSPSDTAFFFFDTRSLLTFTLTDSPQSKLTPCHFRIIYK